MASNPWGAAAQSYGQDLDQLGKIQMGGMQQAAQMPLQLYDRFMDGYEKARQRAAQEQQQAMQQAQLDRQNRLADLQFQKDQENEAYRRRQENLKLVLDANKDITATGKEIGLDYTPDMRERFKAQLVTPLRQKGLPALDASLEAEKILPSLKATPIPNVQINEGQEAVPLLPSDYRVGQGFTGTDTFMGQRPAALEQQRIRDEGRDAATAAAQGLKEKTEARREAENTRRLDQGDRRLDILGERLDKAGQVKPKAIPPTATQKVIENMESRRKIEEAINLIDKNPDALGPKNIVLKHPVGALALGTLRAKDDAGNETRAAVQGIANLVLHDLSGAAVTLSEDTRFQQVLAQLHDQPEAAKVKLKKLLKSYDSVIGTMQDMYSPENGYMENTVVKRGGGKKPTEPAPANPAPATSEDTIVKGGKTYYRWKSDGNYHTAKER